MRFQSSAAALLAVAALAAQDDKVFLVDGKQAEGVRIQSFDIKELKYGKGGSSTTVSADKVARIEVAKFRDVYRRGIADKNPDLFVTTAREQLAAKDLLLAQLGFVEAARLFFQGGAPAKGAAALDELQKGIPEGGLVPEVYRLKFEEYMGQGSAAGFQNAGIVGKRLLSDATTNAWPPGFALEGEFFVALAERAQGGDVRAFQNKMRDIVGRALGNFPHLANRANVQLAHSLREGKDNAGAAKLYREVIDKDSADDNSRAGAYLGLGILTMEGGDAANRDVFRDALLMFLRVRLETRESWGSLQAEALYNAMLAAEKWGGEDWRQIASRCRFILLNEFGESEWARRAKGR